MSRAQADATVFHAIADPNRRAILHLLLQGELAVSAILESFTITQSALSQHLSVLRRAGLVSQRRAGRHRFYAVNAEPLRAVVDWVHPFEKFWDQRIDNLGRYLAANRTLPPAHPPTQEGPP